MSNLREMKSPDAGVPKLKSAELPLAQQNLPSHRIILLTATAFGCVFIAVLTILLSRDGSAAKLLLDYQEASPFPYPFTIQNLMHVAFFVGLGELFVRWKTAKWELGFLQRRFLPEDEETVLQSQDLGSIRRRTVGLFDGDNGFLPSLIDICILQFQSSRSVDQVVSVLNATLELIAHRLDLRYQMIRYIAWMIPTVGFIGTVVGIAAALTYVKQGDIDLNSVTSSLSVAFNTTILALVQSAFLVMGIHAVQRQEERSLNLAGNYTLRNLVNRLYVGGS